MLALAIVFAVILILALLRFGASAEYSSDGFTVVAHVGPLSFRVLPGKEKPVKKVKAKKEPKPKEKEKKPGSLKDFLNMLPAIKNTLSRLRRRLLIKRLTIHFTAAGEDAAATALSYGAANAVFGAITPILENNLRIRRRDFQAFADFQAVEQGIYVNAAISIAVWEVVYIALALLPILRISSASKTNDRKVGKENG